MNWRHFQAFVWLRWRLLVNQLKKGGVVNVVLLALLAVGGALMAGAFAVVFFLVGLFAMPAASPNVVTYVWDGLVVGFLFFWMTGLMVQLQRSEVLSLDKFLHLPVSLRGAFLINYLSSLLSLTLAAFLPAMVALAVGLAISRGPMMLLLMPLLAAFILMVTALSYQFQGWLAALMVNKRRRRTVIVLVTLGFILVCQAPQLVNLMRPWEEAAQHELINAHAERLSQLQQDYTSQKISPEEYQKQREALDREFNAQRDARDDQFLAGLERTVWVVNVVLPPGWLALGAGGAAGGDVVVPLLAFLGMGLIGSLSLWRAYGTTLRLYTGQFTSKGRKPTPAEVKPPEPVKAGGVTLLEWRLPWVSEQASAVATAGFRSLTRAPEAKMLLLTPVILLVVFGTFFFTRSGDWPPETRPLPALGVMSMILLSMLQLVGNQFGFDRSGFRVYVLSAASRGDILLGKNLACAPLALGLFGVAATLIQVVSPMRWDQFLSLVPGVISAYLVFCLAANLLAVFAPMPMRAGSLKAASPKLLPGLLHLLFIFVFPLVMLPAVVPLGVELLLDAFDVVEGLPIALALSSVICAAVVVAYRLVVPLQGDLLQSREQKILETVATKEE